MLGPHPAVPAREEIMNYFESKIIKAVNTWQRNDSEAVRSDVLNSFVKEVAESLKQGLKKQITISDVSQLKCRIYGKF